MKKLFSLFLLFMVTIFFLSCADKAPDAAKEVGELKEKITSLTNENESLKQKIAELTEQLKGF